LVSAIGKTSLQIFWLVGRCPERSRRVSWPQPNLQ